MQEYYKGPPKVNRLHFPPPTWVPGEPIPQLFNPDPLAALARHAAAAEMDEQRRQPRTADRRAA